jgi:hypothetical protein
MRVTVHGGVVVRYGEYGNGSDGKPIAFRDGQPVEYVDLLFDDGRSKRITLDQSINGSRLDVHTPVVLVCDVTDKQEVVFRRDGSERIATRDKWKAVAMEAAPAGK